MSAVLNPAAWTPADYQIDMEEVARAALALPAWRLQIVASGAIYIWTGTGKTPGMATLRAMAELSKDNPPFDRYKARVTACVQVGV